MYDYEFMRGILQPGLEYSNIDITELPKFFLVIFTMPCLWHLQIVQVRVCIVQIQYITYEYIRVHTRY